MHICISRLALFDFQNWLGKSLVVWVCVCVWVCFRWRWTKRNAIHSHEFDKFWKRLITLLSHEECEFAIGSDGVYSIRLRNILCVEFIYWSQGQYSRQHSHKHMASTCTLIIIIVTIFPSTPNDMIIGPLIHVSALSWVLLPLRSGAFPPQKPMSHSNQI